MGQRMRPLSNTATALVILALTVPGAAAVPTARPPTVDAPSVTAEEVGLDEKLGGLVPLDLTFKDENGKPIPLRALIDKPTVLTLNYFRCAGICTPLLNGVAEVVNRTKSEPGKDYQIITVSFDDRDTPDIANRKRTNYLAQMTRPFPPAGWRFLTGTAQSSRALADSVGFKYKRVADDFVHPGAIMFLSPKGLVTRYMYGVQYLPADVDMAVKEAARGEPRPTINKWLAFCYSYDPQGRGYVLNFTRVAATVILALAFAFALVLTLRKRPHREKSEAGT